jgi:hypothetical protein
MPGVPSTPCDWDEAVVWPARLAGSTVHLSFGSLEDLGEVGSGRRGGMRWRVVNGGEEKDAGGRL